MAVIITNKYERRISTFKREFGVNICSTYLSYFVAWKVGGIERERERERERDIYIYRRRYLFA